MGASKVKLSKNLFLGQAELNRITEWWKQNNELHDHKTVTYGIVGKHTASMAVTVGTGLDKISISGGTVIMYDATENELRPIVVPYTVDALTVPTDGVDRWVKLKWVKTVIEEGTCSLSATGQLTGVGTRFTETMRGQPNFATTIEFEKVGLLNTGEFDVIQVVSNTDAWINGNTVTEIDLKYKVIGTFTPDVVVPSIDKEVLEYNSYEIYVETNPNIVGTDKVLLAKVNTDGVTMNTWDERFQWFEDEALNFMDAWGGNAPINAIGVEWAKFGSQYGDRGKNQVKVGWGFRSNVWSFNNNTNTLTVISGSGGIYDSVAAVPNFDMMGWRVYFSDTRYWVRLNTQTTGGTLQCTLNEYNNTLMPASGAGWVMLVPDCDKIQLRTLKLAAGTDLMVEDEKFFPIEDGYGLMDIHPVGARIQYRTHWMGNASVWRNINDGNYLNESSFDDDGVQIAANTSNVVGGEIALSLSPQSYATSAMRVNQLNEMLAGGAVQSYIDVLTISAGVLTAPVNGMTNLMFCLDATSIPNITGIDVVGMGFELTVFFLNEQTLEQGLPLSLGMYLGATMVIEAGTVASFHQPSSGSWRMTGISTPNKTRGTNLGLNYKSSGSDKLNVVLSNDSSSGNEYRLEANPNFSPNSSVVYFPQGSGMVARFSDIGGAPTESWTNHVMSIGDISVTGGTITAITPTGHMKMKVIGKTLFIRFGMVITQTGATTSTYTLSNIAPLAGYASTTSPACFNWGMYSQTAPIVTNGLVRIHSIATGFNIIILPASGTPFGVGNNTINFTAIFELA